MKKLVFLLALIFISLAGFSQVRQDRFKGFFGPVDKDLFVAKEGTRALTSVWLFRPIVELTALQFNLTKPVEVASLSSLGTGISYQHFVDVDGEPYSNFGVNGLILFSQDPGGIEPAKLSFAATVSAFQYVNVGVGYSLGIKKFFILTGVTYSFN